MDEWNRRNNLKLVNYLSINNNGHFKKTFYSIGFFVYCEEI